MKARLPKEAKKNAAISPYERTMKETHWSAAFHTQMKEQNPPPCEGEVQQHTRKGKLIYIQSSMSETQPETGSKTSISN